MPDLYLEIVRHYFNTLFLNLFVLHEKKTWHALLKLEKQNEHFENLTFKFTEKYPVQKVKYMYLLQNQFQFCISFTDIIRNRNYLFTVYILGASQSKAQLHFA